MNAYPIAEPRAESAKAEYRLRLALDLILSVAGIAPTGSLAYHAHEQSGIGPTTTGGYED